MSSTLADAAMAAIYGTRDAQKVLFDIRGGCASPDAVLTALEAVLSLDDPERLRGFARELQKAIERT